MILVTGATGVAGGAVVRELLSRNIKPIRAMCRSEKDKSKIPAGAEAVTADFADKPSLAKALIGVDAAYLVCSPVPDLVQLETNFLEACREAKLGHLVINSALGAADFPKTFPSWHRKVEDKVKQLNLPSVILRPNGFMQNISTYFAPTIRTQDAFYGTLGDGRISLIDVRDVATAAAEALVTKSLAGKVFELGGSEAVNYESLAARISKTAGRTIKYVNLTPQQMLEAMVGSGMPKEQATNVVDLDDYYRLGKGAISDQALRDLIKRAPRSLDAYLSEIAAISKIIR